VMDLYVAEQHVAAPPAQQPIAPQQISSSQQEVKEATVEEENDQMSHRPSPNILAEEMKIADNNLNAENPIAAAT